jgi:hypothetical protein
MIYHAMKQIIFTAIIRKNAFYSLISIFGLTPADEPPAPGVCIQGFPKWLDLYPFGSDSDGICGDTK